MSLGRKNGLMWRLHTCTTVRVVSTRTPIIITERLLRIMHTTRVYSPQRTDARLGSAHASNYRGCTIPGTYYYAYRKIEAANATATYCQGVRMKYVKNKLFLNDREKGNTGIRCNDPQQFLPSCTQWRTAAACSSCSNNSTSTHRAATAEIHGRYIHILTRKRAYLGRPQSQKVTFGSSC